MRVRTVAATLMATFALSIAVPAATQTPAQAATCAGVWVVVDYGSLGGTSTRCATSYGTGTAALKSAGFSPRLDNGMITQISGKPSNPDINKAYWSYWHATRESDGSYSGWSYSNLGGNAYHPTKGNAEGWRYQSLSDGKVPPAAAPPAAEPPAPSPTPKPTTKPTPTRTSKPSATARPTATKKPTARASTSGSKPMASASTAPSESRTPTADPTPAPSTSAPIVPPTTPPGVEATALGQQQATSSEPLPGGGSPVGALLAAGLVVTGGAGVGAWWWLKGRRR